MKIIITESQLNTIKENSIDQSIDEDLSAGSFIVYHRTRLTEENIKSLNNGFIPGNGQAYGRGLYSTYDLNSQLRPKMSQYGKIIVEFSISKFDKILVLNADECKKIYGRILSFDEQMKRILKGNYIKFIKKIDNSIRNFIPNNDITGPKASEISNIEQFQLEVDGMIFFGSNDGKVLVLFETNLVNPLRYTIDNGNTWKNIKTKESFKIGRDKRGHGKLLNYLNFRKKNLKFDNFDTKNKIEIITQKVKNNIPLDEKSEYDFYIQNFRPSEEQRENVEIKMVQQDGKSIQYIQNPSEQVQVAAVQQYGNLIQYIENPSEQVQLAAVQQDGEVIRFIKNPSEELQLAAVLHGAIKHIKNPSEKLQLAAVQEDGSDIQYIENPSEQVQLAAVQQSGPSIQYIIDKGIKPSEQVQLAAVRKDYNVIQYIQNPSEELQLAAVQQYASLIQHIQNPSEQVQLVAVQQHGELIYYIENPSEQVQLVAVRTNHHAIVHIKNPSEQVILTAKELHMFDAVKEDGYAIVNIISKGIKPSEQVQLAAVQQDGNLIRYIQNPSEQVQVAAVQRYGKSIQYIQNPSEELQLYAVQENGKSIQYIENPSEQVQVAAVQRYGLSIQYIQNPSEQVQLYAVQQDGLSIIHIQNPSEQVQLYAVQENGKLIRYIIDKGIKPSEQVQLAAVQQDGRAIVDIIGKGIKPSKQVELAAQAQLASVQQKNKTLNEDVFTYNDLTDDEKNTAYEIFKNSYENATGNSWDKMKFSGRASNWTFYGVKNKGFVVVRKQKSGMNKLTGVAGDLKSISVGVEELNKLNEPTWGMADKKIVNVLTGRYNFISPPAFVVKMLIKFIPDSVFGNTQYVVNKDGSITFNYSDVGDATKYFFGNKIYFQSLLKNVSMNSIVKFAIQKLIS